jgi:glycosyltransferase involved in cell wall biosynthesis
VSRRVRVVRVIGRLNVGGPALHATLLTERLDPERYDSLLVAGTEGAEEGNHLVLRGRPLERLVVLPRLSREIRPGRDLRVLGELVRLLRHVRPDVVHTHTAKAGALGRVAARLAGVPVVVHTYHGHVFRGYFSPKRTRLFLAIERWLARRTDRLLAVSETVRRELLELGVGRPDRMDAVPVGLDLERFLVSRAGRRALRAEIGVGADVPLVGIVARLVAIKAHEVFLRAAARVAARRPETLFVVVGGGERRTELERLAAALGLGPRIRFLGWRADLERIYADLDLAVLCSHNEGSPVSLIEAMAAGTPVVGTRVGGIPDLVEDGVTGCLVPPGEPGPLAEAIVALLEAPERRRALGAAGQRRVRLRHGAEHLLARIDSLYQTLVEVARAGPGAVRAGRAADRA